MLGRPMRLPVLIVAVSVWFANAKNVTDAKSLTINAVGQARSSVVRSERHPAPVERHSVPGIDQQMAGVGASLGEAGSSFISQTGSDAIGVHVAAALQAPAAGKGSQSAMQSKGKQTPAEPTMGVTGKIYLRQPAEHKGTYKTREWFCDACHLLAGKGKHGGDQVGCFTVQDFTCAGGEKCLMDGNTCYFGRVEVPQGIEVTYYSGFSGEPGTAAWDNACVGRTDRGTTSDPNFPELKGMVPSTPPVCAMKFALMTGFTCESASGEKDWAKCGSDDFPAPNFATTTCSSSVLLATAVALAIFNS